MKGEGGKGPRPAGTDGSDYQFRMTVEDRYKKLADARAQLRKLLPIQTIYIVIRGLWAFFLVAQGREIHYNTLSMIVFCSIASWMGTMSMKGIRPWTLRFYFLFTVASIGLAVFPMINGQLITSLRSLYKDGDYSNDFTLFALALIEFGQDVIGVLTQLVILSITFSMAKSMGPGKKRKSDYQEFMDRKE